MSVLLICFKMSVLFTRPVTKSKICTTLFQSNTLLLKVRFKYLSETQSSAVSSDDSVLVVIISGCN